MSIDVGSIELYMGPQSLNAPDNLQDVITDFINGARNSLFVAIQELESHPVAEAIIAARARGLRVRVALEGDYLTVGRAVADPWQPGGQNETNRKIFAALLRSKVSVITDLNPKIFHQKFIVSDPDSSTRAAVLTGSTNFTPTGLNKNLNHVIIVRGKRVSGLYDDEFGEIWSGTFGQKMERHDGPPRTYEASKVKVKTLFAPDHAPEMEIMKQMLKAEHSVDFAVFTFSQSSGIDDTMIALSHNDNITVRGIVDRMQANQEWAATHPLVDNGVEVMKTVSAPGLGRLHHKLMIIDGQVMIGGSFNYTEPATRLNDENILIIGAKDETDDDAIDRQRQLCAYALNEINRIILDFGEPV